MNVETCLLVIVLRGAFWYCRAWGLSREAREGKTDSLFCDQTVIKSFEFSELKPMWNQVWHVNISAWDMILKPCLYSEFNCVQEFYWIGSWHCWQLQEKSLIPGAGITESQRKKSCHEVCGDSWPGIASLGVTFMGYWFVVVFMICSVYPAKTWTLNSSLTKTIAPVYLLENCWFPTKLYSWGL